GVEGGTAPFVHLAVGAGQSNGPQKEDALAVDRREQRARREGRFGGQGWPQGRRDQIGFAVLFQLDNGGLRASSFVRVNGDKLAFVGLANRHGEQCFLDAHAGREVLR